MTNYLGQREGGGGGGGGGGVRPPGVGRGGGTGREGVVDPS